MSSSFPPSNSPSDEKNSPSLGMKGDSQPTRLNSDALFQGASVLEVEHNGQIYRLQKTALNKLILTK